ncbi:MAG: hypothetical protein ACE5L6_01295 [Candidatus Bathyarchaeia archaeon]
MEWFVAGSITGFVGSLLFFLYILEESLDMVAPFYLWLGIILVAICDALFIAGSYGRYRKLRSEWKKIRGK